MSPQTLDFSTVIGIVDSTKSGNRGLFSFLTGTAKSSYLYVDPDMCFNLSYFEVLLWSHCCILFLQMTTIMNCYIWIYLHNWSTYGERNRLWIYRWFLNGESGVNLQMVFKWWIGCELYDDFFLFVALRMGMMGRLLHYLHTVNVIKMYLFNGLSLIYMYIYLLKHFSVHLFIPHV